jgi:hypothetical protein
VHFGIATTSRNRALPASTHPRSTTINRWRRSARVLLGHPTAFEQLTWTLPDPPVLGLNGAFNAYRVLEQDVAGFEAFLDQAAEQLLGTPAAGELLPPGSGETASTAARHVAMREVVASRLCGRWRTGTPLSLSPRDPSPNPPVSDTDFRLRRRP